MGRPEIQLETLRARNGFRRRSRRFMAVVLALIVGVMASMLASIAVPVPAGAATAADLDQCANGPLATPVNCTVDGHWIDGNLNPAKAHYFEGDSVPYRMVMTGLTPGVTYPLTIEWDTTHGGKHALDYLTGFDRTVAGANPCAGVAGCGGTPTTSPIPADPNVTGAGVTPVAGNFTLWGGTISTVSPYTLSGTYAGNSSTRMTVNFRASAATSVLAWGGHISSRADWGMDNSAVAITGSPYHMRLISFDAQGGNQDRSLSAAAVIFPGSITIIKDAVPDDAQDFSFSTTGGLDPANFVLDDDPGSVTPTNTQAYTGLTTFGAYSITEAAAAGWTLTFGTPPCTVTSANGGTRDVNGSTVTIDLKEGENVTCTFVNTRQTGTITVVKNLVPDTDPGLFNLQIDGVDRATDVGDGGTTAAVTVTTGDHTVGEVAGTGTTLADYTSAIVCTGGEVGANAGPLTVNVGNGEDVVCTITNTRQTGTLTVNKVVVPTDDPGRFNLQIDGATAGTGANVGNGGTTGAISVNTGVHTVGETAGTGTNLDDYETDISCTTGAAVTGSTGPLAVSVTNDVNVVCTITNTRRTGTITVVKDLSPASDPGRFDLQIDGVIRAANVGDAGTTGAVTVNTGVHTVAEIAGVDTDLGNYDTTISCTGGEQAGNAGPLTVTVSDDEDVVCTITNTRQTGTITIVKDLSPESDLGLFNLQIDGVTGGTGADVGDGGTTGAVTVPTGTHTVGEAAGTGTTLDNYTTSIACTGGETSANAGPLTVTVSDGEDIVCTITNEALECPPTGRTAARRTSDPCPDPEPEPECPSPDRTAAARTSEPCPDTDPLPEPDCPSPARTAARRTSDPCPDNGPNGPGGPPNGPVGQPGSPLNDPGAEVAGDTNPAGPAPEQVLPGQVEQADPGTVEGPILGFLPRTGAGVIGQLALALLLIGAGLFLRLARRRRVPQA